MRATARNLRLVLSSGIVSVTILATSPLTFATTGGTSGIAVDVAPKENLADGQQVRVTGRGFRAGQKVAIQQCPSPPGPNTEPPFTADDCDPETDGSADRSDYRETMVDRDGAFATDFSVHRNIRAANGSGVIDCGRRQCAVVAFPAEDTTDDYAYDDISFR
jgi:hypothetical protein